MAGRTLLAVLAHPDDELMAAGTLLAQRAQGDRVVLLYLTRGEATGAFGRVAPDEVLRRRKEQAAGSAELLGAEHIFLRMPDCGVIATPGAGKAVARVLADVRPDGLITWGDAWVKGFRHPDHLATGKIARDAVTYARIARLVEPREPHRAFCPVFTIRGVHSTLPRVTVDVAPWEDQIFELADFHRNILGFGERSWLTSRLRRAGQAGDVDLGEAFDAWETTPGTVGALLPAVEAIDAAHPTRGDLPETDGS